jgi:hypothetical protein
MTNSELTQQVLEAVRGKDAAIQQIATAILSKDETQIKRVFANVAGVTLTDAQTQTILSEYQTSDQIAAST